VQNLQQQISQHIYHTYYLKTQDKQQTSQIKAVADLHKTEIYKPLGVTWLSIGHNIRIQREQDKT